MSVGYESLRSSFKKLWDLIVNDSKYSIIWVKCSLTVSNWVCNLFPKVIYVIINEIITESITFN